MLMKKAKYLTVCLVLANVLSHAQAGYDEDLAEAARFLAERSRAKTLASEGDSSLTEALRLERFYKPGDRWLVAVTFIDHGINRKSDDPDELKNSALDPKYFEFTVARLTGERKAEVLVNEVSEKGELIKGAASRAIEIALDAELSTGFKDVRHARKLGFNSFPILLPRIAGTGKSNAADDTLVFEAYDFLMRKQTITWKKGQLWPAVVEAAAGRSVLVREEKVP